MAKYSFFEIANVIRRVNSRAGSPCSMDLEYAGDDVLGNSEIQPTYLIDSALEECLLVGKKDAGEDYKLYIKKTGAVATTLGLESKCRQSLAAFAIDQYGRLYIHEHITEATPHKPETFFHSSFFSGGPGKCFGMIKIEDGKITYISNHSGHYKPDEGNLNDSVERLNPYLSENCEIIDISEDDDDTVAFRTLFA